MVKANFETERFEDAERILLTQLRTRPDDAYPLVLLRDVIDLDATYGGGPDDADIAGVENEDDEGEEAPDRIRGRARQYELRLLSTHRDVDGGASCDGLAREGSDAADRVLEPELPALPAERPRPTKSRQPCRPCATARRR